MRVILVLIFIVSCSYLPIDRVPASTSSMTCLKRIKEQLHLARLGKLTKADLQIIEDYVAGDYRTLNAYLRHRNLANFIDHYELQELVRKDYPDLFDAIQWETKDGFVTENLISRLASGELKGKHWDSLRKVTAKLTNSMEKREFKRAKALALALSKIKSTQGDFFRSISSHADVKQKFLVNRYTIGTTIEETFFLSTTTIKGGKGDHAETTHLFQIKGKTAKDITSINPLEKEYIFLPGTQFKVTNVKGSFIKDENASHKSNIERYNRLIENNIHLFKDLNKDQISNKYQNLFRPIIEVFLEEV